MSEIAPGLSYTWLAGQVYTITDQDGKELEVTVKESEDVLAFIHAFDVWRVVEKQLPPGHSYRAQSFEEMMAAFENLPGHVARELPSVRMRGIVIPGQRHLH